MDNNPSFSPGPVPDATAVVPERQGSQDWNGPELAIVRNTSGRTLRKSCDRCHKHKLRCIYTSCEDTVSRTRCIRCQRARLECVYGARAKNKPGQDDILDVNWEHWLDKTPISLSQSSGLGAVSRPELHVAQLDESIHTASWSWPSTIDDAALAAYASTEYDSNTASFNSSAMDTLWQPENNAAEGDAAGLKSMTAMGWSSRLCNVCRALEEIFAEVMGEQSRHDKQDYPIGEVLDALDAFLGVLATQEVATEAHARSKDASMVAQGYCICVRLMALLSETMLQSLLSLPTPASAPVPAASVPAPDATSTGSSTTTSSTTPPRLAGNLRLGDLHAVPNPDPFGHALHSTIRTLHVGRLRLGKIEELLAIPHDQRGGVQQQEHHAARDRRSARLSLSARFVASIWEDEASMKQALPAVYLQRCRAAINGLSQSTRSGAFSDST